MADRAAAGHEGDPGPRWGRRRIAVVAAAAVAGSAAAIANTTGGGEDGSRMTGGPLEFPTGYSSITAALPEPGFATFQVCTAKEPARVMLTGASARLAEGSGEAEVRAAWVTPAWEPRWGAGRLSNLEPQYKPVVGEQSGAVSPCGAGLPSLDLAVVFPDAGTQDVFVDAVTVDYEIDGVKYRETVDIELGVCAWRPVRDDSGIPECREGA